MDRFLYLLARGLVGLLQSLPLPWVARLGRIGGGLAFWLDGRHRRVALENLELAFGLERSPSEIRALARENFSRLGETYCCALKTASMSWEELRAYVEFADTEAFRPEAGKAPPNLIVAIGHFGNFELYARFGQFMPGYQCATTYRGLRQPKLNALLQSLRERSGCLYFERRSDAAALRAAMGRPGLMLGLLSDQNAGRGGLWLPFFGRECSTSPAAAIFALRYHCRFFTGFCFRTGLGRWRLEAGPEIPTHQNGRPRTVAAMTLEMNRAFEEAVRHDPANWFWVHNRWKSFLKTTGRPRRLDRARRSPATEGTNQDQTAPLAESRRA